MNRKWELNAPTWGIKARQAIDKAENAERYGKGERSRRLVYVGRTSIDRDGHIEGVWEVAEKPENAQGSEKHIESRMLCRKGMDRAFRIRGPNAKKRYPQPEEERETQS